jgi:hypothetical protein
MNDKSNGNPSKSNSAIVNLLIELVQGYISSILDVVEKNICGLVKKQEKRIFRNVAVAGIFLTGGIFALVGIAMLTNQFFNVGPWPGFVLIGAVLIVVGFIMQKSSKQNDPCC